MPTIHSGSAIARSSATGTAVASAVRSGSHTTKLGGIVSFADYDFSKQINGNPLFTYRGDISWDFPASAAFGSGNPDMNANNYQFGLFAQDDWAIGPRLTLNLGLRWDYESDMLNND